MTTDLVPLVVLVLDDRAESRHVAATWLRRSGFSVVEAATGAEALTTINQGRIDVAVLDVNLPDMSGYEVCEAHPRPTGDRGDADHPRLGDRGRASRPIGGSAPRRRRATSSNRSNRATCSATITALIRRCDLRDHARRTAQRLRATESGDHRRRPRRQR